MAGGCETVLLFAGTLAIVQIVAIILNRPTRCISSRVRSKVMSFHVLIIIIDKVQVHIAFGTCYCTFLLIFPTMLLSLYIMYHQHTYFCCTFFHCYSRTLATFTKLGEIAPSRSGVVAGYNFLWGGGLVQHVGGPFNC